MRRTVRSEARAEHEILGALLRKARENAHLSQRDLATRLDRTQAFVWKVESGRQHLDIPTLLDIAAVIEVKASELVRILEEEVAS